MSGPFWGWPESRRDALFTPRVRLATANAAMGCRTSAGRSFAAREHFVNTSERRIHGTPLTRDQRGRLIAPST